MTDRVKTCDCTHTQACEECGETKGIPNELWSIIAESHET